jgi:hypothetical protein
MENEKGYVALMHEVCVGWGFCGSLKGEMPLHVDHIIPSYGPVSADQFVDWLFLADGLNPEAEPERWQRHKAAIRAAFARHMGAEIVDAHLLRYDPNASADPGPHEKYRGWIDCADDDG